MMKRAPMLVMIPTYNERENVTEMIKRIQALGLDLDILFVDDNSPDGTGKLLDELKKQHPNLCVIHRPGKMGIGAAHMEGIRWAYQNGYKTLITMDCDFTHSPENIPDFIKAAEGKDVVVGTRYKMEKSLAEWNAFRKLLTNVGHFLTEHLLGVPYDATGAFRLYKLDQVPLAAFEAVRPKGYAFFFESLFVLCFNEFSIAEVPISLPARTYGHSKMSVKEIFRSVKQLFSLYFGKLFDRQRFLINAPAKIQVDPALHDEQGWDTYWNEKKKTTNILYDLIAEFYRKFIIRPLLNHFVKRHFPKDANVLHAGCGSGQVDADVRKYIKITALDISVPALQIYNRENRRTARLLHGSIFSIPAADGSYDGIYNLGVMEHFTQEEIDKILREFHRVVKKDGKILLFWPPEFGSSVIFLKFVHFMLNKVMKKNMKLHPDEISRVQSKKSVLETVNKAGFETKQYYFGPRDFFTYTVIAASKNS